MQKPWASEKLSFYLALKTQLLYGYRIAVKKGTPIDSNDSRKKAIIIWQLKKKKGEGAKVKEFNASKGGFDNLERGLALKKSR